MAVVEPRIAARSGVRPGFDAWQKGAGHGINGDFGVNIIGCLQDLFLDRRTARQVRAGSKRHGQHDPRNVFEVDTHTYAVLFLLLSNGVLVRLVHALMRRAKAFHEEASQDFICGQDTGPAHDVNDFGPKPSRKGRFGLGGRWQIGPRGYKALAG